MELEGKSLLAIQADQEGESISLNRSDMDLLTACSNEMEGTVIIYDNDTQEGQVVKIITNPESKPDSESVKIMDDFSDLITLHASTDVKNEVLEEPTSNDMVDLKVEIPNNSEEPEIDSDDDETIATFITSTGQQLALYAVEDSDEIFAVALYDESGEPPTNFHFLMKADVERLIGEGAVKTVKKPQVQPNKGTKPPEKKEEIKFERYQDVKPTVQKVETPPPQTRKVEQVKTEMIEVPQPRSQMGLPKPRPQMEVSTPKSQVEVSKPRSQVEVSKPQPQVQVSKPQSQMELSKPRPQVEVTKTRPQVEVPKSTPQMVVKPKPQVELSKAKSQVEVPKSRPPVEVSKPKSFMEIAKSRQQTEMSKPRVQVETPKLKPFAEISKPRAQVEIPKPKTQIEVPKGKSQVAVATPKSQMEAPKFKPQMEIRKFQFTKSQENKSQKIEQPKTIITKNTSGVKKIFTPMRQSTPKIVNKVVSNVPQPVMNIKKEASISYVWTNESESFITEELNEEIDSDAEIIEQSTVQYILCDEGASDEELTFDELQASLQSFNMNTSANKSKTLEVEKNEKKNDSILRYSPKKPQHKLAPILSQKKDVTTTVYRTYKNPKKARTMNNLLQTHRKIKQEVEDPSYDFSSFDDGQFSSDDLPKESDKQSVPVVKAKRSRKQQLTVVNRTDSEIIIQPASAFSEEEEEPVVVRKRGRRKKKLVPDPDYNPRRPARKKTRSNRSVEVINIDIEEGEIASAIASGKGKGSSDKENDVISVGDSEGDEEEEEEEEEEEATGDEGPANKRKKQPVMQCTHCLRNFRKRRALERHLHACPKSPANLQKLEERKRQQAAGKLPKRFKCKSCDETFDMALGLARHVRSAHSPRKRGRPVKNWSPRTREFDGNTDTEVDDVEETSVESESEPEPQPEPEPEQGRSKRRGRPPVNRRSSREESSGHDFELKLDSSGEQLSGPRRRGRPPAKKTVTPKEKSPSPDVDEKSGQKGRRRKQSLSNERTMTPEQEEDDDRPAEPRVQIPKKRGRPIRQNLSKDGKSDTETEEKIESDSRKRGRQSKLTGSKEESEKLRESCAKVEVKLVPVEIPKKRKLSKEQPVNDDTSSELKEKDEAPAKPIAEIPKKRRLSKEEPFLKDSEAEISKTEKKVEKLTEPSKDIEDQSTTKDEKPVNTEEQEETAMTVESEENNEKTKSEPQRKRLPSKDTLSKEDSDALEEEMKKLNKIEEALSEAKKSERLPVKDKASKEDTEASEEEITVIETIEEISQEPQKSQLSVKDKSSKEDTEASEEEFTVLETIEETTSEQQEKDPLPDEAKSSKEDIEVSEEETKTEEKSDEPISEPRRRGRQPAKDKSSKDDIEVSEEETKTEEKSEETTPERRRRGRQPTKDNSSKDDIEVSEEEETKAEEKGEETTSEPRRRGRQSAKDKSSKEDTEVSEEETKTEGKSEETTPERRRRGRLSAKDKPSKENAEASDEETKAEAVTESPESKKRGRPKEKSSASEPEESIETSPETRKRGRSIKEITPEPVEPSESAAESRKRGRSAKDKTAGEESQEAESSASESVGARKRSRTARSSPEVEAAEAESAKGKVAKRKLPSPNRTWKVKKLNCADCGKWFSSAAALSAHRLQHRTKKSGHRLQRCRVCHKRVPEDTYAKHQALAHGRAAAAVAPELRLRGRARPVVAGAARRRRSLRSAN